jgi:MFS superfamily sulfate permease-like transporter
MQNNQSFHQIADANTINQTVQVAQKNIDVGRTPEQMNQILLEQGFQVEKANEINSMALGNDFPSEATENPVSTKSILLGVLFLVAAVARLGKHMNDGHSFSAIFGLITGTAMAIYFFTKRG